MKKKKKSLLKKQGFNMIVRVKIWMTNLKLLSLRFP